MFRCPVRLLRNACTGPRADAKIPPRGPTLWVFPNPRSPLERITEDRSMVTATDHGSPTPSRADRMSAADASLFALLDELRRCERRRDDLLDRLAIEDGDYI